MRKALSMLAMFMLVTALSFAQQTREVTGRVIDDKGEPVPFASILIKGTKVGGTAQGDGTFSIRAKTGDVIVVSSQKSSKEVLVGSDNVGTVVLERIVQGGEIVTVVTTALGIQRQPQELGYSLTKVSGAEVNRAKVTNFQAGLQGKVSGLNVAVVNNGVFGDTRITLRGIRSLTGNNQPLLVVDGVPISLGFINSINPNDIADVNIIKGNTGSAIYGQDGANGVIVINTKKGTRNKPVINIGTTIQFDKVSYYARVQDQFGNGEAEDASGNPVYWGETNNAFGDKFDGSIRQVGADLANGDQLFLPYKSQLSERLKFWNTGVTFQKDISLSTGDDNSRFYMSVQDVRIDGVKPNDVNRRTTFRLNASREFNRLRAAFNLNYIRGAYDVNIDDFRGVWNGENIVPYILWQIPINVPITMLKDWKNNPFAGPDGYVGLYTKNPYMLLDLNRGTGRSDDLVGNIELSYRIAPWLSATYRLGSTVSYSTSKSTYGALLYSQWAKDHRGFTDFRPAVGDGAGFGNRVTSEVFLTAKKKLGDFNVDLLLGQSLIQRQNNSMSMTGTNLVIPSLFNISNRTGEPSVGQSTSMSRTSAYFGKLTLGYKDFAFLELGDRYEQDSKLPINANDFNYPSAGLSLVLSRAIPALSESKLLSYLKLRGSYAKSGNVNLNPYQLESTFGVFGAFPYGTLPGYTAGDITYDPNIKPEFVESREVGLEIGFNKNRINFEATAYQQDNSEQILGIRTSSATGFTTSLTNAAAFVNKGLEFDLRLTPLFTIKDFSMDVKLNYSLQDNEVTKLYPGLNELSIGSANYAIVGLPAYVLKLNDYRRDPEGRVIINRFTGLPSLDPALRTFGRTLPKDLFGSTINMNYKNFSLSITGDYRGGHQMYQAIGPGMDFGGQGLNTVRFNRQRFVFPNSVYEDPANPGKYIENTNITTNSGNANFWTTPNNFYGIQSNYITSAAAWKIREVALSYNVPAKALGNGKVVKAANITLTGRNLAMFRPTTNWYSDPENNAGTGNAQGVTNNSGYIPATRQMGVSVNLTF